MTGVAHKQYSHQSKNSSFPSDLILLPCSHTINDNSDFTLSTDISTNALFSSTSLGALKYSDNKLCLNSAGVDRRSDRKNHGVGGGGACGGASGAGGPN